MLNPLVYISLVRSSNYIVKKDDTDSQHCGYSKPSDRRLTAITVNGGQTKY